MMIWISIAAIALITTAALAVQRLRLQRFLLRDLATTYSGSDDPAAFPEMDNPHFHTRVGRKIFSREDLDLLKEYPAEIRTRYLLRKRAVALQWLHEGRRRVRRLMRVHRRAARAHSQLEPREELALMANYALFLIVCSLAEALTVLAGPLALSGLAERASRSSQSVSELLWQSAGASPVKAMQSSGR